MKIVIFSNDAGIREAAESYAVDQGGQVVVLGGDWRLLAEESLVIFAHGTMAREAAGGVIAPAYIGDQANPDPTGRNNQFEANAETLAARLANHAPEGGGAWRLRIQACETADINLDLVDNGNLPAQVENGIDQRQLPDSFAGELQRRLAGAEVRGRWGSPTMGSSVPSPNAEIWKIRCYHDPNLQADNEDLVRTVQDLGAERLWTRVPDADDDDDAPSSIHDGNDDDDPHHESSDDEGKGPATEDDEVPPEPRSEVEGRM